MKKSLPARRNKKTTKVARRPAPAASSAIYSFPVIGIGTSAGGLEALEHFLTHVPKNMPYRTHDDVVITFADITVAKTLEAKMRDKHTALEKHVEEESAERAKDSERAASDAPTSKPTKAVRKSRRSRNP
jgi:chemotaxis response regulator CheB